MRAADLEAARVHTDPTPKLYVWKWETPNDYR